jgi:serine phosphatase RsbU (regulator of sigma subunit)
MFLRTALETKEILSSGYRLRDPAQTMARLNETLIAKDLAHTSFATALYGYINTRTLELTVSCGGHPCPILLTQHGDLRTLEVEGALLGVFPGEAFTQRTIQLEPGDRVFAHSDGIEWAFSDGNVPDTTRWREQLHAGRDLPTEQVLQMFARQIDGASRKDDLTIIAIEAKRQP